MLKRWYYRPANFSGAPERGNRWFERMKDKHWKEILAGALCQAWENSLALMPAKEAKPSKCFPLLNTSVLILLQTLDMLEPPASALIPTEDIAAEKAKISDSDIFTKEPVPASRSAISVISDSVVAKLFPQADNSRA